MHTLIHRAEQFNSFALTVNPLKDPADWNPYFSLFFLIFSFFFFVLNRHCLLCLKADGCIKYPALARKDLYLKWKITKLMNEWGQNRNSFYEWSTANIFDTDFCFQRKYTLRNKKISTEKWTAEWHSSAQMGNVLYGVFRAIVSSSS